MDKSKEEMLRLVKQLFALGDTSRGATVAEAENAMSKAKLLMAKHNISMSELEVADMKAGKTATANTIAVERKGFKSWEIRLMNAIDHLFETAHYTSRKMGEEFTKLYYFGCAQDVELAIEAYKILRDICQKTARKYCETSRERNEWRTGFAHAVCERSKLKVEGLTIEENNKCISLMVVKDQIIAKMSAEIGVVTRKRNSRVNKFSEAFAHGYSKGKVVDLKFRRSLS